MPLYIAAVAIMIIADQLVKHWAFTTLQAQHTIPLIENVFHLTYIENRGAAFSMFARFDSRWIFVALAVVISIIIGVVLSKKIMQTATGRWSLRLQRRDADHRLCGRRHRQRNRPSRSRICSRYV